VKKSLFVILAAAALVMAARQPATERAARPDILVANLDTTVNPTNDFFDYANGGWVRNNPIPADESSWGIDRLVQKELYDRLLHINEEARAKSEKTGVTQQIGDFWYAGMDTVSIEKSGIEPLRDELNKIRDLRTTRDVMAQAARMHTYGVGVFYRDEVSQDEKNSDIYAFHMSQGGLGMPNREYYFNTDPRTTKVRIAYPKYVASIFMLMGYDSTQAGGKAAAVLALASAAAVAPHYAEAFRVMVLE